MDSPESTKPTTTTSIASATAPVQDSPVFRYINNLSPIQPAKASVTQGFPGLNSPPLVFTSPRLNLHCQPTSLKSRAQYPITSFAKLHGQFDGASTITGQEKLDIQLNTRVVASGENATDSNSSVDELIQSPSGSHKQFLEDILKVDSPGSKFSFDSTIKSSQHPDHPTSALTCSMENLVKLEHENTTGTNEEVALKPVASMQTEEVQNENTLINVSAAENDLKQGDEVSVDYCSSSGRELPAGNSLVNQDEDYFMTELQNAETALTAAFNQSSHLLIGSKFFQNRGVRRRCLQFEDAERNVIYRRPAQDPSDSEGEKSLSLETSSIPIDLKLCPINTLNSSMKSPKPSGIGLHLNSIVNTVQAGSSALVNVKATRWGDSVSATTDFNKQESYASVSVDSASALTNDSAVLKANQSISGNKSKNTEKGSGLEETNNLSSKKKRTNTMDGDDGCKRCNCKRSKCLKLYCDCFAAGIYCAEPCSCQECFNRPDYEDTVAETRQKIESRDPFAFAPRVVKHTIEQPTISCGVFFRSDFVNGKEDTKNTNSNVSIQEDGSKFTPASARHKKGCKCKRSLCLKKYCECYQANVGCSDGCRCEGCKNVYGQKGENGLTKIALAGEDAQETTDGSFVENFEKAAASGSHTYHPEFVNLHNLTPPTPAFQFSDHGKGASKVWFPSGKYILSPESCFTRVPPYVMPLGTPINSDNATIPESANNIVDLVCFDQESHHGTADTMDEFSAVYPQSRKRGYPSDISNLQKWQQYFSAKRNQLSESSLVWHGSPITPMAPFCGMQEAELDVGLSNSMQDDTPEILKDTSTPLNIVKSSSPNKKRVSPPHSLPTSSPSVGIRTRKFTLKAVPSFPPLTPCIDSKMPGMQQDTSSENHSAQNKRSH